jgi:hypothetical protein
MCVSEDDDSGEGALLVNSMTFYPMEASLLAQKLG